MISNYVISDIEQNQKYTFTHKFTNEEIDSFANLSGDKSPIHIFDTFAKKKGFEGRVVHGAFIISLISRLIGMNLPGENSILVSINMKFHAPVYANEGVQITGVIDQISSSTQAVVISLNVYNLSRNLLASQGKAIIGFTN